MKLQCRLFILLLFPRAIHTPLNSFTQQPWRAQNKTQSTRDVPRCLGNMYNPCGLFGRIREEALIQEARSFLMPVITTA